MHSCHHGQALSHQHHHIGVAEGVRPLYLKKLQIAMALAVVYLIVQAVGAYFSDSLALWADAGHKLADILAMGLALGASWLASLATSKRKTFGFHRLEILAALINGMALLIIALYILYEAVERLLKGEGFCRLLRAAFRDVPTSPFESNGSGECRRRASHSQQNRHPFLPVSHRAFAARTGTRNALT